MASLEDICLVVDLHRESSQVGGPRWALIG